MEDVARDTIIKVAGPWPVIGGGIVFVATLAAVAYKIRKDWPIPALLSAFVALGVLIGVLTYIPAAQAACRTLYNDDTSSYVTDNCDTIVDCPPLLLTGSRPAPSGRCD